MDNHIKHPWTWRATDAPPWTITSSTPGHGGQQTLHPGQAHQAPLDVEGKRCSNPGHGSYNGSTPGHGGNEMFPLDNNNYFTPGQICSSAASGWRSCRWTQLQYALTKDTVSLVNDPITKSLSTSLYQVGS